MTRGATVDQFKDEDERQLAEMGYKQELNRGWSALLELRDLVHDHLGPRRLLHDLRPGVEQRRPDRDLLGLAADLDPDPDHRLLHVGDRRQVPDRGRHLLVGRASSAARSGAGSPAGSTWSAWSASSPRSYYACATFLNVAARPLRGRDLRRQLRRRRAHPRRDLLPVRAHPRDPRDRSTSSAPTCWRSINNISVFVARARRRGDHRDPGLRPRRRTRASTSSSPSGSTTPASATAAGSMFWFYVLPLGFLLTQYTITGFDASAHISEETHGASRSAARGVWQSIFYSARDRLVRAAGDHLRGHRRRRRSPPARATAPAARWRSSASRCSTAAFKAVVLISTIGQLFCGLACLTSASRMCFAFSRDRGLPGSSRSRR